MEKIAETPLGVESKPLQPSPLNLLGKIFFGWNYLKNQLPRGYPFDFEQYRVPSFEARSSLWRMRKAIEKGRKGADPLTEAKVGFTRDIQEGVNLSIKGRDYLKELPQNERTPVVLAFTHPNTGLGQGSWVHFKGFEALAPFLYEGDKRSYHVLLGSSRSYIDKMTGIFRKPSILGKHPLLSELGQKAVGLIDRNAKQILVNVANAENFILEGQSLRLGIAMKRGNILGVFPSTHAEAVFSGVDRRVAQLLGTIGRVYGAPVLPIAASYDPKTRRYFLALGAPRFYNYDNNSPDAGEKTEFIARDLEAVLKSLSDENSQSTHTSKPGLG